MPKVREDDLEKLFWSRIDVKDSESCWEWKGGTIADGYGKFWLNGKNVAAHRIAWTLHYKQKIPEGMHILHHCDNRLCCNHNHLYCGTNADNMRDMVKRGRSSINYPEKCVNNVRLYDEEVWLVKKLWLSDKISQSKISKMFKVSQATISRIVNNINTYTRGPCPR